MIVACHKNDDNNGCTATANTQTAPAGGNIIYTAKALGNNSKINSVTYYGASGSVTVNNPTSPWQLLIPVQKGGTISISVSGVADTVLAGYTYLDSNGANPIAEAAQCR
ncbi:hypothetical protein DN068_00570 [Taibaiella soli]|uniref:Uncharacterized protein n=1 Tax=Taibaiella soli TaxID=1649169 RepID=A0A2W2BMP9_9BACT|nr:hypothetical protein DN068_00570 [Taibaiella soli]